MSPLGGKSNLGEGHIENDNIFDDKLLDKLLPYSNEILSLTRKMVIDFVDEILVDNNKNIWIKFRFADELKKYHYIFE